MPLTSQEIPNFDLLTYLNTTGLPEYYGQTQVQEYLKNYVGTYLQEEIKAEALTRNLLGFIRFLEVVAVSNGEEITGVAVRTVESHFNIFNDTLLGFPVQPFVSTVKRKAITRAKYFLFDVGVVNSLAQRGHIEFKSELMEYTFGLGRAFCKNFGLWTILLQILLPRAMIFSLSIHLSTSSQDE